MNHSGVLQRNIAPEECNAHMYGLWPRCNRESWSEAPDRASSWGWDGWLPPTADPLPSVDQLQPHDSQSAPAAQELLNFHNLLRGPDTMHAACRLCYDVKKKRVALYIGYAMFSDSDGAKVWHVNHWEVGMEGKCQFVLWWPEWLVKMLGTKTNRLGTQTVTAHDVMEQWSRYLVALKEFEMHRPIGLVIIFFFYKNASHINKQIINKQNVYVNKYLKT